MPADSFSARPPIAPSARIYHARCLKHIDELARYCPNKMRSVEKVLKSMLETPVEVDEEK